LEWPRSLLWPGVQASSCGSPVRLPHPCSVGAGTPSRPGFRTWGWTAAGGTGTRKELAPQLSFPVILSAITSVYNKAPLSMCCFCSSCRTIPGVMEPFANGKELLPHSHRMSDPSGKASPRPDPWI